MKRQRSNASFEELSFEDLISCIRHKDLSCDELKILDNEIQELYSAKASLVAQDFPSDLLLQIFNQIEGSSLKFWLNLRGVSKSWCATLTKFDLSRWVTHVDKIGSGGRLPKLLSLFHWSAIRLFKPQTPNKYVLDDLSILTRVQILFLAENTTPPENLHLLSHLTQLTHLGTSEPKITQEALNCLTSLESLAIQWDRFGKNITTLEPLSKNLRSLVLHGDHSLTQEHTKVLQKLTYLEVDDPDFFQSGKGTHTWESGTYTGEWKDGKFHGIGKYINEGLQTYTGEFKDGIINGKGVLRQWNPRIKAFDTFTGEYALGKRLVGTKTYGEETYDGDWLLDLKHGRGTFKFKDGTVYDGQWQENEIRGKGKCSYANGDSYEGDWALGMRHGHGVYVFKEGGIKVEGEWLGNHPNFSMIPRNLSGTFCDPLVPTYSDMSYSSESEDDSETESSESD